MNERLHQLQELRLALEIQRGQLLIERSSLVTPARIEERAVAELGMRVPEVEEIQVIRP
jgi:cell division protein FtsL